MTGDAPFGRLVTEKHMLSGLAVAYGTADWAERHFFGSRSEVKEVNGRFVPDARPLDEDSLFDLASLTKLFTCVALLQLMERRCLRMADTIGGVDERFKRLGGVSLYDAMSYRVSLQSDERLDRQTDGERLRALIFSVHAEKTAGARVYSDMNALVLKYIVEKAAGCRFEDYLQKAILEPLGLRNTLSRVPEPFRARCVNYNYEHRWSGGAIIVDRAALQGLPHDPKARVAMALGLGVSGHAGLFASLDDMVLFAQGLLSGRLVSPETLRLIGLNRTGYLRPNGDYRQFMGLLCFSKSPVQRLSELPSWMGRSAFGLSGYTGNHIAIDPDLGVFDLMLGNRCHNRLSRVSPEADERLFGLSADGSGLARLEDGRKVYASCRYVYLKDALFHRPVYVRLCEKGKLKCR